MRRIHMTNTVIHPHEKKAFIYWFLNQYEMKVRESNWILTYLASNNKLLRNLHFVRHAKACPRSIIISTSCSNGPAFRFHRERLITSDPEKAFHDIRLNDDEPLYVQLNFHQWKQSPQYAFVLEENPFLSDENYITEEDKQEAERVINYTLQAQKKDRLLKKIDESLDERNYEKFIRHSEELKKIEKILMNQPVS